MAFVYKSERSLDFASHEYEKIGPGSYNYQDKYKFKKSSTFISVIPFKSNTLRKIDIDSFTPGKILKRTRNL